MANQMSRLYFDMTLDTRRSSFRKFNVQMDVGFFSSLSII